LLCAVQDILNRDKHVNAAMENLRLTLACNDYDRTRPLIDGRVRPAGIELSISVLKPRELFPRMLDQQEFDISELSLGSYASLVARGDCPFVAIPVPISRVFRHTCIYVRAGAGIRSPQDLKGKRVGTTQYGATAVVMMKGMLQDEYGVLPGDLYWLVGGLTAPAEKPLIPLNLPDDVTLKFAGRSRTLEGMFAVGELDALCSIHIPRLFLNGSPDIVRLFPDFKTVEQDYFRRTGIFPIMHIVAIRKDVYIRHPWIAQKLYAAFCQARDFAIEALYDTDALLATLPWLIDHIEESRRFLGRQFWPYGLEPNRPTLQALCRYVYEQGLAPRLVHPDELFVPVE
jgi:4,5-dihydroxyphthalate decarboxylase